jgi:hypothetical protein
LSRLVYLHVPAECACLPYLPALRRFLHHRTLHPTLQSAQDPPTATVPILYFHCRSCPLKLLHFRPAITYRHSASPLGTTHVVLDGRTTLCPPHTNYLTTARSHAEIVSCSLTLSHTKLPVLPSDYHIQNRPPFRNYPRPRLICFPKWLPHEASLRCDHLYTLPRQTGCLLLAPLPPCVQSHLSLLATSLHASKLSNHLRPAPCTPDMAMALAAQTPIL